MKGRRRTAVIPQDRDVSVMLCGAAGSGIQTVEQLLIRLFKAGRYHVCATKEYMSRVRGGSNSTQIRISSIPVRAPVSRVDVAILFDKEATGHSEHRFSKQTLVLGETAMIGSGRQKIVDVPFSQLALEAGNKIYANNVAFSVIAALLGVEPEIAVEVAQKFFTKKSPEIIAGNIAAIRKGYAFARENLIPTMTRGGGIVVPAKKQSLEDRILVGGSQAVGLGAVAGGCNFIGSYPMSPGTGVLTFLSANARRFGIVAEQAEDEISAINMAVGAGYAGGRSMVTTSGGGFALMEEGVSLAAMIETPVVIHVAQRPGPATGLPTRTAQEDLNLALYAGHGEFPRAIFAPGDVEDAFRLTVHAFDIADKFQTPVFILTDQHLMDSYYDCAPFSVQRREIKQAIVKTEKDYRRYAVTPSGISPRGIPGYGDGLVLVDSDEHDEWGRITEDMAVRSAMVQKRLRKMDGLKKAVLPPVCKGPQKYRNLIVSWGSTGPIVEEAWKILAREDTAFLHFRQVFPVHKNVADILKKARQVTVIENNATGQFARLLRQETGVQASNAVLKYDGLPFFVDELSSRLRKLLGK